jgi:hypothetical protein
VLVRVAQKNLLHAINVKLGKQMLLRAVVVEESGFRGISLIGDLLHGGLLVAAGPKELESRVAQPPAQVGPVPVSAADWTRDIYDHGREYP